MSERASGQRTEWNFNITKSARIIRRVGNTPINKYTVQQKKKHRTEQSAQHKSNPNTPLGWFLASDVAVSVKASDPHTQKTGIYIYLCS